MQAQKLRKGLSRGTLAVLALIAAFALVAIYMALAPEENHSNKSYLDVYGN